MKKCIIFCAIFLLLRTVACGEKIIVSDFYLNGREYAVFKEKNTVLPNTLRLSLFEGEASELRAEVRPEGTMSEKLSWRLLDNTGAITIYPAGETCSVCANYAGVEHIGISLSGEGETVIEVEVKRPKEITLRSFEPDAEKSTTHRAELFIRIEVAVLIVMSLVLFGVITVTLLKKGRKK